MLNIHNSFYVLEDEKRIEMDFKTIRILIALLGWGALYAVVTDHYTFAVMLIGLFALLIAYSVFVILK